MWYLLVCALLISECSATTDNNLVVETNNGKVQGVTLKAATGKDVDAWLGIPFGKPPVGGLRFKLPQPAKKWTDIFQATSQPNSCVQTMDTAFGTDFAGANMWNANTKLSEDCLYLNVITPKPRPTNAAVMVWIYGGGYYCGSATLDIYDPKTLVAEENVIVVSIQYRVTSLGFLYLGSDEAPGNMGLFDQRLALKWVKQNIQKFGGDPNKITLFGESTGSASVGLHLMAPDSHDLFNNAIMESGTAFTPWAFMPKELSKERGLKLSNEMQCSTKKSTIDCLRKANETEMVYTEMKNTIKPSGVYEFPFTPVLDSHTPFFKTDSSGKYKFKKTSVLLGSNKEEGTYFLLYVLPDILKKAEETVVNESQYKEAVKRIYYYLPEDKRAQILQKYKSWSGASKKDYKDAINKMVGDSNVTCSVNKFADFYAGLKQDVYTYVFDRYSNVSPWPKWTGAMHGEEIYYVFGEPLNTTKGYDEKDKKLTKEMMKYWANFAKTGDPNKDEKGTQTTVSWPKYDRKTKKHLELSERLTVGSKHREKQCQFWSTVSQHISSNDLKV